MRACKKWRASPRLLTGRRLAPKRSARFSRRNHAAMNPTWMFTMLLGLGAAFAWSANRRWQLLKVGRPENRTDNLITRLKVTWEYAFVQKKMDYYPLAGLA